MVFRDMYRVGADYGHVGRDSREEHWRGGCCSHCANDGHPGFEHTFLISSGCTFSSVDSFAAMLHGGRKIFPLLYGETYLDVVLFTVPRSIWPDKPAAFSKAVADYVTNNGNDVPPGVIGELYINFHVFGIVGGMFLLGCLMAIIHQRTMVEGAGSRAMYAVFLPYFGVFLTRNFLGGGILLLCSVLPMWPAIRYIRKPPSRSTVASIVNLPTS